MHTLVVNINEKHGSQMMWKKYNEWKKSITKNMKTGYKDFSNSTWWGDDDDDDIEWWGIE